MNGYKTIRKEATDSFVEKRSKFIAYAFPVTTEEEALAHLEEIRKKHWDATHNVYAYVLREGQTARYSDDGEPGGTGGVPMLEVIRKEGLTDLLLIATRYFGGVLLGAGGLVRAYTKTAKLGIDAAGVLERRECRLVRVTVPYHHVGRIQKDLEKLDVILSDTAYAEEVTFSVEVPVGTEGFGERMTDLTNGQVQVEETNERRYVDC